MRGNRKVVLMSKLQSTAPIVTPPYCLATEKIKGMASYWGKVVQRQCPVVSPVQSWYVHTTQ